MGALKQWFAFSASRRHVQWSPITLPPAAPAMQRLLRCCVWLFLTACATSSSLPTRRSATETIAIDTCEGTVLAFDIFADDSALIMVLSGYGRFYRAVPLPEGVDANACNAQFKDGVLEVTVKMPKQTQQKRQRIDIK